MSCASCGSNGTPNGCKNNGTCSSGGCNKLEVYNWLSNMALPGGQTPYDILEIRFKNSRKGFFKNVKNCIFFHSSVFNLARFNLTKRTEKSHL